MNLLTLGLKSFTQMEPVIVPSNQKVLETCQEGDQVRILQMSLQKTVHLMPQQSKWVTAVVDMPGTTDESKVVGIMSPKADILAGATCDFTEGVWNGEQTVL